MKFSKIFILTVLSFLTIQSFAQTPLESLRSAFSTSAVSLECDYETMLQNTKVTGHSELYVQGKMYIMRGYGLEVYCNGTSIWTIDESSHEMVIDSCSDDQIDYMANPALILADIDKLFEVKSHKSIASGKVQYIFDAIAECGVRQADIVLTSEGMITDAVFVLEDADNLTVKVTSMKKAEEKPASFFSPQQKFGSDWIVTDLR